MTSFATTDSSLLLMALAAALGVLGAHVAMGWLHEAQRLTGLLGPRGLALILAAVTLGSGMSAASALILASEALSFPIGYRTTEALLLWASAMGGCALIGLLLLASARWWSVSIAGLALGALVLTLHAGWINAAGFRPGVTWEPLFIAAGAALLAVGCCSGLLLGWSDNGAAQGSGRGAWRLGAAVLIGLSAVTGMVVLDSGLALPIQIGSVYSRQLSSNVVSLIGGVLLPLVLSVMAIDLHMRRRQRRHRRRQTVTSMPVRGHRRKHRIPTL